MKELNHILIIRYVLYLYFLGLSFRDTYI